MSFETLIAEVENDIVVLAASIQEREDNGEADQIDNDEYVYLTLMENMLEQIKNHME